MYTDFHSKTFFECNDFSLHSNIKLILLLLLFCPRYERTIEKHSLFTFGQLSIIIIITDLAVFHYDVHLDVTSYLKNCNYDVCRIISKFCMKF